MRHDPTDDPFADLFGALPDPRMSEARRLAERAVRDEPAPAPTEPAAPTPPAVPTSRRAAREAAARAAGAPGSPQPTAIDVQGSPQPATVDAHGAGAVPAPPYRRTGATGAVATAGEPAATVAATRTHSIEDLFSGEGTSDDIGERPPPPDRRRRRIGGWIALGVVLLLLGGVAAGGLWVWNTYEDQIREVMGWEEPNDYEPGLATGEADVVISSGDVPSAISQTLYEAGVTMTPEVFYEMLIDTGQNPTFYPGVYRIQQKMTAAAALEALQDPASKLENSALLREGLTVAQTLPLLSEGLGIALEDFQAAVADPSVYGVSADSLEGWLFPAMYTFDPDVTAQGVIQAMVQRTVESLDSAGVPEADRQEILTIASIIQREARYQEDFYKVSRVIQNRLDPGNQETFGLLQMDSTAQYGYGEMHDGTVSSSAEALADDNPWNTYVHTGLPVGPIANPGDMAIDAAMHPADGDWLYFVTVNLATGETVFTSNLSDHNAAVAQWRSWCADNPDAGC